MKKVALLATFEKLTVRSLLYHLNTELSMAEFLYSLVQMLRQNSSAMNAPIIAGRSLFVQIIQRRSECGSFVGCNIMDGLFSSVSQFCMIDRR